MKIISILVAAIALFQGLEILGGLIRRKDVPKRERIKKILIFLFLCIICACSYVLSDDEASENNQSTQDDTAIVSINDDNLSNLQNSSDSTSSESVETTVEPAEPTASIASPTPTDLPSEDSADTSNPNPLPTDNLDENSADADDSNPSLFANCYVDYTPEGVSSQVGFDYWDDELTDMQGQNHEGNLHLFIGDLFNMIQTTGDSMITATVHCIVNPECDLSRPLRLLGRFVVGSDTMGSDAYTDVLITIDDTEVWRAENPIYASTVKPTPFDVIIENGDAELTIIFECNALDSGLSLGIVFDSIEEAF